MGFLDRLFGRSGQALDERLRGHRERAEPVLAQLRREVQETRYEDRATALPTAHTLKQDGHLALSVLVALTHSDKSGRLDDLRIALARRALPYERGDVELLVSLARAANRNDWTALDRTRVAVAAIERYAAENPRDVEDLVEVLQTYVAANAASAEWTGLAVRLRRLARSSAKLDLSPVLADDPWARRVRPLVERDFQANGPLLAQLGSATASRPSAKWEEGTKSAMTPSGPVMIRRFLEVACEVEPVETGRFTYEGRTYVKLLWLSDPSATTMRGALWATALVDGTWRVELIHQVLLRCMKLEQIKVANAALYALGAIGDDDSISTLSALAARVKDRRFTKGIDRALEAAALVRGITIGQLREAVVPTFGLDLEGRTERVVGPAIATLEVGAGGSLRTTWTVAGQTTRTVRSDLVESHAADVDAVKAESRELKKELTAQRLRMEDLLAESRQWSWEDWQRHYYTHPLVRVFARHLIWHFDAVPGIPVSDGVMLDRHGAEVPIPEAVHVRLLHPIDNPADEVARWRAVVRTHRVEQPFKQAFREVYLVAPAELETGTYSNRFAGHVVRYPQTYALMKTRGWGIVALGPYDNAGGRQWRDFPEQGIRVEFWMEHIEDDWGGMGNLADLASTDQVRFCRIGENDPMRIDDVPALVFSEAMRDVDLFVGATSIAADPGWLDGGEDRFRAYWTEAAFGALTESAVVRRELLAELIPVLKIADRLSLEDKYLRVRGNLRTYRIHLGSGNILMEPNDEFLCIVASRAKSPGKVFLPFPEDERFSIILSKAFLLAADDTISDPTITQQIQRSR